jgi:hypothetical protein
VGSPTISITNQGGVFFVRNIVHTYTKFCNQWTTIHPTLAKRSSPQASYLLHNLTICVFTKIMRWVGVVTPKVTPKQILDKLNNYENVFPLLRTLCRLNRVLCAQIRPEDGSQTPLEIQLEKIVIKCIMDSEERVKIQQQ